MENGMRWILVCFALLLVQTFADHRWFCKHSDETDAYYDYDLDSCPIKLRNRLVTCWEAPVCCDVDKILDHGPRLRRCIIGSQDTTAEQEKCKNVPLPSVVYCNLSSWVSNLNLPILEERRIAETADLLRDLTSSTYMEEDPTPAPRPAPQTIYYYAQMTFTLVNTTFDQFTDEIKESFRGVILMALDGDLTSDEVIFQSISEKEQESPYVNRRYLQGITLPPSVMPTSIPTAVTTLSPTTPITTPAPVPTTITPAVPELDVSFKIGLDTECNTVENYAKIISKDDDISSQFLNAGIPATEVYQGEPYTIVASDELGTLYVEAMSQCSDYIQDDNGGLIPDPDAYSESNGEMKAQAGLIVGSVLVAIAICMACSFVVNRFFPRAVGPPKDRVFKRCVSIGALCIMGNSQGGVMQQTRIHATDMEGAGEPLKVLTLEAVFCNALAKECLRQFMLQLHMEQAFLFFEKVTDQVLRPHPKGSAMAAAFKQQILEEFVEDGAIHQLKIKDTLRREILNNPSTRLASLLPLLKEVHSNILTIAWPKWVQSPSFLELMTSNEMKLAEFSYVMEAKSQLDMAETQSEKRNLSLFGVKSDTAGLPNAGVLLSPLWANIPLSNADCNDVRTFEGV